MNFETPLGNYDSRPDPDISILYDKYGRVRARCTRIVRNIHDLCIEYDQLILGELKDFLKENKGNPYDQNIFGHVPTDNVFVYEISMLGGSRGHIKFLSKDIILEDFTAENP